MPVTVLIVPGYTNSGPQHWQTLWHAESPDYKRVEQRDWDMPSVDEWTNALNREVLAAQSPVVFVAHSLGCLTVAHWVEKYPTSVPRVAAGFLVAPPDVERLDCPPVLLGFAPIPRATLPFRTMVVASTTDPYIDITRSYDIASAWGASIVDLGDIGHINTDSGLGNWIEGRRLLDELLVNIV